MSNIEQIGKRIREEREKRGWTRKKLAALTGLNEYTIADLELGTHTIPRPKNLKKFAAAFSLDPDDLTRPASAVGESQGRLGVISIPILGTIPAGYPDTREQFPLGHIHIPKGEFEMGANTDQYFGLKVNGNSLSGDEIFDGQVVIIDPEAPIINGKIYAVEIDNESVLRHVFQMNGRLRLMASNGEYKDIDTNNVHIRGRVIISGTYKRH